MKARYFGFEDMWIELRALMRQYPSLMRVEVLMPGAADDWMYEHLGILGFTVELWDLAHRAIFDAARPGCSETLHPVSSRYKHPHWKY